MSARREFLIKEEATKVKNNLGVAPDFEQRCVTVVAKRILLDGPYYYNGRRINPIGKSIGAGVWSIKHKEE
jgi:hypothetical protein